MTVQSVLLPLFVEVGLTFVLWIIMAQHRTADLRRGTVKFGEIALRQPNWPPRTLQAAYAFSNQFELPVLFYVLTILAWVLRHADLLFVVMAWIFVLSRLVHAYVHVTSNHVPLRGAVYGIGALVLLLMWIIFAVRILLGLP